MASAATAAFACIPTQILSTNTPKKHSNMYGLIGKVTAEAGQRDALIEILIEGADEMPGCLSYIVSKDSEDDDVIWVTEVWDSKESHQASLSLPSVQEAMAKGKPLIAEFGKQIETEPVGGHGLISTENQ
jgi:quinol monooxygenase YgiN